MQATVKELRFQARELLETVKRGEEVVITDHGRPCAKIIPLESQKIKKKQQMSFLEFGKTMKKLEM